MKAIVYRSYGSPDVLSYEEIEKPIAGDDQVLIKIRAASINPFDQHFMRGTPYLARIMAGLRKPKMIRLGVDVAGEVESVGSKVTQLKPGDKVFGACRGAYAEYACTSESSLVLKPDNVTFEQAAAVDVASMTALQGLRDRGKIRSGQKVLINGASGGVGTFAVQIAKTFGADVTGVCSTSKVDMVCSIGADRVIDYTKVDFTESGQLYDLILDCFASHSLSECRRALNPKGSYVVVGGDASKREIDFLGLLIRMAVWSPFVSQNLGAVRAKRSKEDLNVMSHLMKDGKVIPVIDRSYKLSDLAEAMRYFEGGHARGKVVVTM